MRRFIFEFFRKIVSNGVILIILLFTFGIIGSHYIMDLDLIDSIYYAVITMAAVGYGDFYPTTAIQKIFAVTLALGGVGFLAYIFNVILTNFQERMSKYSKGVRKMRFIEHIDNYYILCGYGRVGKVVYKELNQRKQNVIIIEKNEEICEDIKEDSSTIVLNKDATEDNLIAKLAAEKCKSVIISTGDDVTNLFIVLTIREINPDAWIVTRASKTENFKRLRKAGADKVVSPEIIGGKDLYLESAKPHLLRLTVQHTTDEILNEFKIISKHGCTLENIDYHFPGIESPLSRTIKSMDMEDGKQFWKFLNNNKEAKDSLNNLYNSVDNIHSHWISGPNKKTLEELIKDLEKRETIIGKNLTDKEISELTKKEKSRE